MYNWNYELFVCSYFFSKQSKLWKIIWKRIIFFIFKLYKLLDFRFFQIHSNYLGNEKLLVWFCIISLVINLSNVQKHSQFIICEGSSNRAKIKLPYFEKMFVNIFLIIRFCEIVAINFELNMEINPEFWSYKFILNQIIVFCNTLLLIHQKWLKADYIQII